ncbi:MAG: Gfo/Idh/MocA family protein [Cellulosilyticaceae bacterium]
MAYKLAIVGYGGMGEWHHKSIKEKVKEIEVVGSFDIRQERMEKAKEAGLKTYATLNEVLADEEIDIVTIATPNDFHKDIAIACMRSGKNVVCEKPVTMNAEELEAIMAVQKETGKVFSVHQNRRWDKDYVIIKEILNQNLIGKPYYIETKVQGSRRYLHGWRGYKVNGGGMLYDWGVHLIDQVMDMIDSPVTEVGAHFHSIYCEEVDDNFKMMMRFENGLSVLVEVATNCFLPQPRWHMCCIDGSVIIEDWSCNGKIVKLDDNEELVFGDVIVYTEAGPTRTMAPRPKETTIEMPLPEVTTDWSSYYKNIAGVLDGEEELIVKPEQALRVMRVIDCVFKSVEDGASVKCHI